MVRIFPLIFILLWSSAFITTKPIIDNSDPFAALSQVGGMLGSTDQDLFGSGSSSSDEEEEESSYFSLFDDPKDSYSDAGRDYISEYTTFFRS